MRDRPQPGPLRALAILLGAVVMSTSAATPGPRLGAPIDAESLSSWAISIAPDGRGLPDGSGTVEQGRAVYQTQCLACHGEQGRGGPHDALAGVDDKLVKRTVGNYWPCATTLFDYIRRAMPLTNPQSLHPDQVYAVVAWILHLNGLLPEDASLDAHKLATLKMPNRDQFYSDYGPPACGP
ncbi:MAG: cytochrome c [Spongiibacteraceae bacterium]|jgi:cytochrome c|nr:cytochrome c [Spongiibacteraceae bacterium]